MVLGEDPSPQSAPTGCDQSHSQWRLALSRSDTAGTEPEAIYDAFASGGSNKSYPNTLKTKQHPLQATSQSPQDTKNIMNHDDHN